MALSAEVRSDFNLYLMAIRCDLEGLAPALSTVEDLGELHSLFHAGCPYRAKEAIKSRMAELLWKALPSIEDLLQLRRLHSFFEDNFAAQGLICSRLQEILLERLPTIDDWSFLAGIIFDGRGRWDSHSQKILECRMSELLEVILPTVTDFASIHEMWDRLNSIIPDSDFLERIELRGREILRSFDDSQQLIEMMPSCVGGSYGVGAWVDDRIVEVLRDTLPTMSDCSKMTKLRRSIFWVSKADNLIDERVKAVLGTVSAEYVPTWFIEAIKSREVDPFYASDYMAAVERLMTV